MVGPVEIMQFWRRSAACATRGAPETSSDETFFPLRRVKWHRLSACRTGVAKSNERLAVQMRLPDWRLVTGSTLCFDHPVCTVAQGVSH